MNITLPEFLAALTVLSRRERMRQSRLSSLTKLRGGAA